MEPETIVMAQCAVLSPNALGAILDHNTIPRLHAYLIGGAAGSGPDDKAAV
jgi:glutamate dehydrogenase/leucine dehydrogenase